VISPVHAALTVGLGLLFEGRDEPLDPRTGSDPKSGMTLPCDDSAFLLEAVEAALALSVIGVTWSSASEDLRVPLGLPFTLP